MSKPWWAEGLRFRCEGPSCGDCCSGRWGRGYVWVTVAEMARIAAHLGVDFDAFTRRYVRQVGQRYALVERPNLDCVFYVEGAGCSVYEARPDRCQTYPFWSANLESPEAWAAEAEHCPGLRCGEDAWVSAAEIEGVLGAQPKRIPNNPPD